jgi:hypothetical protein
MEAPMSGISGDRAPGDRAATEWTALSSEHERLIFTAGNQAAPVGTGPARWAELASQRERLLEPDAPLGGLVSSSQDSSGLRLVVPAA